jgi:hypothetical protein
MQYSTKDFEDAEIWWSTSVLLQTILSNYSKLPIIWANDRQMQK